MTAALLARAGEMLHGVDWKHALGRDLGINHRNFRRMTEGELPIPPGVWPDIRRWLLARSALCKQVAADLPTTAHHMGRVIDIRENLAKLASDAGEGET